MRLKITVLLLIVWALAAVASAQTKISGTAQCGKPELLYAIQVGDRPNHSFVISQSKCSYTKFTGIAGMIAKEFVGTTFSEISGNRATSRAFAYATMDNSDKFQFRSQGSATMKEGVVESDEGTWTFVGGTGKLKGLKGKGTYKGKAGPEGITLEIEGEHELAK